MKMDVTRRGALLAAGGFTVGTVPTCTAGLTYREIRRRR